MQRKGAWDNSDLAKKDPKVAKKRWSNADKAYATVGSVYLCIWCLSVELCVTSPPPPRKHGEAACCSYTIVVDADDAPTMREGGREAPSLLFMRGLFV